MDTQASKVAPANVTYICPMHREVRQSAPGKCPKCNMDLIPEGSRFAMLRHVLHSPMMQAVAAVAVAAVLLVVLLR